MSDEIVVSAPRRDASSLRFSVRMGSRSYDVGVPDSDAAELASGVPAVQLVRESFRFLLENEGPESILARFDLPDITHYYPQYPDEMRRRLIR